MRPGNEKHNSNQHQNNSHQSYNSRRKSHKSLRKVSAVKRCDDKLQSKHFMKRHLYLTMLLMAGMPALGTLPAYADPVPQQHSQVGTVTIKGTVVDENNEPVIGASVVQKGAKTNAAATDAFGNFTLKVPAGATLEISYVGYKPVSMKAADGMTVYLEPTTEMLNELVAIGYGSQKRANLTGAVATVDVARTMESRPQQDVTRALQGAVPGLTITTASGGISQDSEIKIRGVGSLSNSQNSAPLIVVDGVPTDDLNFINPEDIAEISVLKDAASSAIYGARAAFGVILITTKEASRQDRVSVKYENNFSWNSATVLPNFSKASDNIKYALQSALRGSGAWETEVGKQPYYGLLDWAEKWEAAHPDFYTDYRELKPYVDENNIGDYYVTDDGNMWRYAQWDVRKTLFNSAAPSMKHNVSLEGTSGKTQYRASFGYDSKQGLLRHAPDKMHRYMANLSVSTEIFKFLKAGARFNFSQREYEDPNTIRNSYQYLWRWNTIEESYGYATHDGITMPFRNDISNRTLAHTDKQTNRMTRIQAWALAQILPELTLQADFTYEIRTQRENDAYTPSNTWDTWTFKAWSVFSNPTQANSFVRDNSSDMTRWTTNAFATYSKTFAQDHSLKVMAGFSADRYNYDRFQILRRGVIDYDLANLNLTNGTNFTTVASALHRATCGFFGRVNYDYKGIYLFEANGRYDGSSAFPANDQWAFFPSVSAGYRFSEENYFKPLKSWFSNGKLRASWGQIGNENIGNNMFISTINAVTAANTYWINSQGLKLTAFQMPTLVPGSLTWERITTADVGLDLGFFDNQLTFGFDWYQRDTKDMIAITKDLPEILGTTPPAENGGNLRTRGWELSLGWNHSFGDAQVYATFNIGDATTKITEWSDNEILYQAIPDSYSMGRYHKGQTLGEIYGFKFDRFFEESDFNGHAVDEAGNPTKQWVYAPGVADQTPLQTRGNFVYGPGDVKFKDLDGDGKITAGKGTISDHGDVTVIGNMLPRYEYSFRLGAAWKGFDIDLFFQGVGKRKMWYMSSFIVPQAQSNGTATFDHQLDYNTIEYNDQQQPIAYHVDQNNWYPNAYGGGFNNAGLSNNMLGQGSFNFLPSDRYLLNMAYLRMKNITVGYTIPTNLTQKAWIQRARVYFSTENPFFIYNGAGRYKLDAELNTGEGGMGVAAYGRTHPMMKSFSFGIQVTF